jgi:hypothetical protein
MHIWLQQMQQNVKRKKGGLVIVGLYVDNFFLLFVDRQGFQLPVLASDWLESLQIGS